MWLEMGEQAGKRGKSCAARGSSYRTIVKAQAFTLSEEEVREGVIIHDIFLGDPV